MQKRKLSILVLSLFLINSVSAYSLGDLLGDIDSSTMILGAIFVVSFAVLNFALSRFFKDKYGEPNKATAGIVSFVLALLMTWGINETGFDIEGLFFDIGISSDLLYTIIPILILAGITLLIWKFKKKSLLIIGGLFILASFFVYEKTITLTIGAILLVIGIGLLFKKKPRINQRYPNHTAPRAKKTRSNISFSGPRQEWVTKAKAGNKLEEDYANIKQRQKREDTHRQARRDTRQQRKEARIPVQQARQQKAQERRDIKQQRKDERAQKLAQIQEQKTAQQIQVQGQEDRQGKNQKMIIHLEQLAQKKDMELQKQQMMAAKGVTGAKQKIRTLEAELVEIARKMKRYQ